MTLESEINHLKAAIEEVRGGGSGTFDLYAWLALNRDHLLLMVAELLLVLLICCLTLSRRAYPAAPSSPVAISHAEHLLLNAQLLNTGANVKVSGFELERSFSHFIFSLRNLFTVLSHCLICLTRSSSSSNCNRSRRLQVLQVIVAVVVELRLKWSW